MIDNRSVKKLVLASIIISICLYLSGCVSAKQKMVESGQKPLTNQELKQIFTEKKIASYISAKGRTGKVTYLPDGSQSAVDDKNGKTYPGTYYFDGDKYCSKMDHRGGEVRCTTWFRLGDNKYQLYRDDGSKGATVTFQ